MTTAGSAPGADESTERTLTRLVQVMFPHKGFPERPYRRAAQAILTAAANDLAMREHAWSAGVAVHEGAGATGSVRTPPYPSTHNLATCRMSERREDGVVDKWGRARDVRNLFVSDGSVFTTGAAANPTLTIVALAIRQAEHIADLVSKGDL